MAEDQGDRSDDDLTEETSATRLEEFRRKGMVAQSRELSALAALLAAGLMTYAMAPQMSDLLGGFMREVFRTDLSARMDLGGTNVLRSYLMKGLQIVMAIGLPVSVAGFVLGAFSSFAQIGSIFTTEPLSPDITKIDPLQGLQKLFSKRHFTDSIRMLLKMVVSVTVCYFLIKTEVLRSPGFVGTEPGTIMMAFGHAAKVIFLSLIGVLAIFAIIDFILQKREYHQRLRMTKQEAKEEHREREGDPQIKARIRSIQREMARRRMMNAVKKADVIITNPTHIAIALQYDKSTMFAPKVVAKGADFIAQKIKKIASDAGVPLVENVPLARTLYKTCKIGQIVPRALYQAVAEVLAYVYRLKKREI